MALKRQSQEWAFSRNHPAVLQALEKFDCASASYDQWFQVGAALRLAELPISWFDGWSMTDPHRYKIGVCEYKWSTFDPPGKSRHQNPTTLRSIFHWARDLEPAGKRVGLHIAACKQKRACALCGIVWPWWLVRNLSRWPVQRNPDPQRTWSRPDNPDALVCPACRGLLVSNAGNAERALESRQRNRPSMSERLRDLWVEQKECCYFCSARWPRHLAHNGQVDHIIARAHTRFSSTNETPLGFSCPACNADKGIRSVESAKRRLHSSRSVSEVRRR